MEYGKFKSADDLFNAYTELEKSFTQKCQQLSNLQQTISNSGGTSEISSPPDEVQPTETVPTVSCEDATSNGAVSCNGSSAEQANFDEEVLQQYFKQNPAVLYRILQADSQVKAQISPPPTVMVNGGNASMALPSRPKTIREASQMVEKLFK